MSIRRNMLILGAGTALVFAAPAAIAGTESGESPEGAEPVASVDAPAVTTADPTEGSITPPAPVPVTEPEPEPAPVAEPTPPPETAPTPEPAPQPEPGPAPDQTGSPDGGPKRDSAQQQGTGRKPASAPPRSGPAAEPGAADSAPTAAQQTPAEPAPAPGDTQGCVITSAGLVCPGDPDCVITSSGVSCASQCTITSAGLSCPGGGEVLPNQPVSGGPQRKPKPKPAPGVGVKPEREAQDEGETSPTTIAPAPVSVAEPAGEELPFTGAPLLAFLVTGFALSAGGLLLRRRTATGRTEIEPSSDAEQLPAAAAPPADAPRPGSRWSLVLQTLALLALGMLMSRRTRR
jgi:hypothetical protein